LFSPVSSAAASDCVSIVVKRPAENEDALTSADVPKICKMPKLAGDICTTVTSCVTPGTLYNVSFM